MGLEYCCVIDLNYFLKGWINEILPLLFLGARMEAKLDLWGNLYMHQYRAYSLSILMAFMRICYW